MREPNELASLKAMKTLVLQKGGRIKVKVFAVMVWRHQLFVLHTKSPSGNIHIKRETGANVGRTLPIIYSSSGKNGNKINCLFVHLQSFLTRDESAVFTRAQTSKIYTFTAAALLHGLKIKHPPPPKFSVVYIHHHRRWALYTVGLLKHSLCVSHRHLSNPYVPQQHAVYYIIKRI